MPDIKIFVSHRIDINSELIDNPLYVPVRCGAVFDKGNLMNIGGDDTGEHISAKRMTVSEFTVQYWAWKNVEADYYGLCHYRRFLSFAREHSPVDEYGMIPVFRLTNKAKEKYGLLDRGYMEDIIGQYDLILAEPADVAIHPAPRGKVKTVRQLWDAHDGIFITKEATDEMFRLIDALSPEYSQAAQEYFAGDRHRGYNCYVMRRELFVRLCEFQFPIIFAMEDWLKTKPYCDTMIRIPGYIGEMLYGIFTYHVSTRENWKVHERQLVLFKNTVQVNTKKELIVLVVRYGINQAIRRVIDCFLPKGSKRRIFLKGYWYRMRNRKKNV